MKILILRSVAQGEARAPFSLQMNTSFAERFLCHLTDKSDFCRACGENCRHCREHFHLDFSEKIAGIIDFPAIVPMVLEDPEQFLPSAIPEHDVLVAISVNEEILAAFLERFKISKGVIVPIEESNWITPNGIRSIRQICEENSSQIEFPKPFCAFDPKHGVLLEAKKELRIGLPETSFKVKNGLIESADVVCSAPCGATYYTASNLAGKAVDRNIGYAADTLLSSYPCTADTAVDKEFNDSIIHQAVKTQRRVIDETLRR